MLMTPWARIALFRHRSFFFFQAEDGIRDLIVTGVQTCALPISKAKFERTKPHVNVGTIGHVDHGKTTLTAALTKVAADKGLATYVTYYQVAMASESQGRRDATKIMTIATSHGEYATTNRHTAHVDCPGHADY